MKKCIERFFRSRDGATAVEYGLIASVVAVGIVAALLALGPAVEALYLSVVAAFSN